ncbi:MAG: transposase, partial [Chloroflexota bacterium]|nr:transposase [Chloroflexota bacterium]
MRYFSVRSIRSFPELSLSPVFRRKWPSAYAAIEGGQQDQEWLEGHFINQIPAEGVQVFSLDGTAWPHPEAKALADRQYVYSGGSVVVGHPYSVLAWVPERGGSWAPPVSVRRVTGRQTATEVGVAQVKRLCHFRGEEMAQRLHLIVGDCKYGNHRFLGPLKDELCGALVRMRRDRVVYGEPGPYSGMGRPRVH